MSETETSLVYGLNTGGFVRMRLPEIRRAIFNDLNTRTGLQFDESPDSFTGQFVSIFAEREAAIWELCERAYLSAYPATAQGVALDLAVSYAGVARLQPVRSRAIGNFTGQPGTEIPAGSIVQATVSADAADIPPRFMLAGTLTLTKQAAIAAALTIPDPPTVGAIYWVDLSGVRYSVVAQGGVTGSGIAAALDNQIGNAATYQDNKIFLNTNLPTVMDWSSNIQVINITCSGILVSEQFGPIQALERTITNIVNPANGWEKVVNPFAAIPGQVLETDEKLRSRYSLGVYRLGAGTIPSIFANIQQSVPGITSLKVYENATDSTDSDGRPPHSIECVIEGGDTDAVFRTLYHVKPGGITAFGNTSGTVLAADGYRHPLAFSRPELRWVWLQFSYAADAEQSVPGDISGQIIAALMAAGGAMMPGQDTILDRLKAAPFASIPALARLTLTAAVTAPNASRPTAYSAADIAIGPRQKAVFDPTRIVLV